MSFCQSCFELKSPAKPGVIFMLKKTSQIVRITFQKGSPFDAHTALIFSIECQVVMTLWCNSDCHIKALSDMV